MASHGYIDESGTMDSQGVMSVGMIVLEGARSAEKLHEQVMTAINPKYLELVKQMKKGEKSAAWYPKLHFADMDTKQKVIAGKRLAKAKVSVYTAHHRHVDDKSHDERFAIYRTLTKICINKGFADHKDLVVGIAKQGGWQKYERDFMAEMRELPDNQPEYRKADFELLSATKPGIQLADFYVGAVRAFLLDEATSSPYDLVEKQIICVELHELATTEGER